MSGKFCGQSLASLLEWQHQQRAAAQHEVQPPLASLWDPFALTGVAVTERVRAQRQADTAPDESEEVSVDAAKP